MIRSAKLLAWATATTLSVVCWSLPARADASSWFLVGGGVASVSQHDGVSFDLPTLQLDMGLGSSPAHPFVVGGLVRSTTMFGEGTDWSALLRTTTRGFSVGDWGVAVDAGIYRRMWGGVSDYGPTASVQLGAPWGLQLSATASFGRDEHETYALVLGVDLMRLTVMRLPGEQWWPNPRPAWKPTEQAMGAAAGSAQW